MGVVEFLRLFPEAFREWYNDRAPRLGAALAYYTVFSIAPLLVIVIAISALVFGEEVMAPIDGLAQRLVPRDGDPARAGEQPEAIIEPRGNLLHRQGADPCSGELDRERDAVEPPADLGDRGGISFGDPEFRDGGDRALHEEANGLVLRELVRADRVGVRNGE